VRAGVVVSFNGCLPGSLFAGALRFDLEETLGWTLRAVSKSHQPPPAVSTSLPTMRTLEEKQFFRMATP
jgi:hypothetical protein